MELDKKSDKAETFEIVIHTYIFGMRNPFVFLSSLGGRAREELVKGSANEPFGHSVMNRLLIERPEKK
jgi:hypothetical protein